MIGPQLANGRVLFSLEAVVRPKHCFASVFRAASIVVVRSSWLSSGHGRTLEVVSCFLGCPVSFPGCLVF